MIRDPRYGAVKVLIETGHITSFQDIFQFIPRTTVYKDLGVNFKRFVRATYDPSLFRMEELVEMAEMFDVDPKKLIDMAYEQMQSISAKKRSNATKKKPKPIEAL